MDAEILEKIFNEIMVCKICNGSVSILVNRNCHENLRTKLVLGCKNSRCTSGTSFHRTQKNESRKSYQINTISTFGMRALGKDRNAALKLFSILNLRKPVSHVT